MVEVQCACGTHLRLGDEWGGKRGKCPACNSVLDIPHPSMPSAPAEPMLVSAQAPLATVAVVAPPLPLSVHRSAGPANAAEPATRPLFQQPLVIAGAAAAASLFVLVLITAVIITRTDSQSADSAELEPAEQATGSDPPLAATAPSKLPKDHSALPANSVSSAGTVPPLPPVPPTKTADPTGSEAIASESPSAGPSSPGPSTGSSTELVSSSTRPKTRRSAPRGLSGASNRYSDSECCSIQEKFGFRIPPGATLIEINGEVLPVENVADFQQSTSPYLLLPAGEHLIRLRAGDGAIEVKQAQHFGQVHAEIRQFFQRGTEFQDGELFSRGAQAMDVHGAPFLLNLMGASYASKGKWDAAERKFRRALRVNPAYSPAHLNLAHCLKRSGKPAEVKREILLAEAFNVGNVFGLSPAIVKLKRELQLPVNHREPVELRVADYVSLESKTLEDDRLEALMLGIAKYATRKEEEGKIRNNLAIHFADSRRPELALEHFRGALHSMRSGGPDRFRLARHVLSNMHSLCVESRFVEAEEYALMRDAVLPGESP